MGNSKALETTLNNKLLGSHEHLEKGLSSPPCSFFIYKMELIICTIKINRDLQLP